MVTTRKREFLCRRVNMMEGEGPQDRRIATKPATTTLVLDHSTLQRDSVNAAIAPAGIADQLCVAPAVVVLIDARAQTLQVQISPARDRSAALRDIAVNSVDNVTDGTLMSSLPKEVL